MTLIVNLYAGPGAGKSTLAYELAGKLKRHDYKAELVVEYAKQLAYKKAHFEFTDQISLIAHHNHNLHILKDQVDIVVCDCSFLNTLIYTDASATVEHKLAIDLYNRYENIGFILPRRTKYHTYGRYQTEDQAKELDRNIKDAIAFLPKEERRDLSHIQSDQLLDYVFVTVTDYLKAKETSVAAG